MRILLVEDDELLGEGIKTALDREGYQTDWLKSGLQAKQALSTEAFELVILDLGLPDIDGIEILTGVRKSGVDIPILILTARDAVEDKITGLDSGADDYLIKPFELSELKARLRALGRRRHGHVEPVIEHGRITYNPASLEVTLDNKLIDLSRRETTLLVEFLNNPNRVMSKAKLEDVVYGWDIEVESNSIEVHVHHLRKKLYSSIIKTIRGVGYKLESHEK
ncbi:response regulator [Colwellia psychrerythraea]|uniref:Two component transcriptional regulator, winged helix family n=1 Tax=Colwellia psychrerythraea TaxID=28229 RepID=A0A099KWJ1_COLPS|nr:response regulator [Colwellia psychrerythraea]KGJ94018.1 two component transcriptional regulator, winged helix family [Colwellia psychrerythraea]